VSTIVPAGLISLLIFEHYGMPKAQPQLATHTNMVWWASLCWYVWTV